MSTASKRTSAQARSGEWGDLVVYDSLRRIFLREKLSQQTAIFSCRTIKDATGQLVAMRLDEWKGVVELYAISKHSEYVRSAGKPRRQLKISALVDSILDDPSSPFFSLAGSALFADSKVYQKRQLKKIKNLSQRGDNDSRQLAAKLRRQIPRTRRRWGVWKIHEEILPYRAEQRLLWLFIKSDLEATGEWDSSEQGRESHQRLRDLAGELLAALPWLQSCYSLDVKRICARVQDAGLPDKDTAQKFGFKSANALRKFLSTYRPSL